MNEYQEIIRDGDKGPSWLSDLGGDSIMTAYLELSKYC